MKFYILMEILDEDAPPASSVQPLWASLKNDNDTADRHENRQLFFVTLLDNLKMF